MDDKTSIRTIKVCTKHLLREDTFTSLKQVINTALSQVRYNFGLLPRSYMSCYILGQQIGETDRGIQLGQGGTNVTVEEAITSCYIMGQAPQDKGGVVPPGNKTIPAE